MDLQTQGEERLENLPSRERFPDYSRDRYRGWNFPYRRMNRWLESNVGKHIDSVIHQYVNAVWVPKEFRQAHHLAKYVETNTFIENGKVCFYDAYCHYSLMTHRPYRIVEDEGSNTFYVDPSTRLLCLFKPRKRRSYLEQQRFEKHSRVRILGPYHQLYKLNGIWYEIRATIMPDWNELCERKGPNDILLENENSWSRQHNKNPRVRVILKRQLNHKELTKHGLRNESIALSGKKCEKCGGFNCLHHRSKSL